MIGNILYVTYSRPNIMYIVCLCVRYSVNPKESHINYVKMIIRYVAGTCDLCIWYSKDTKCTLVDYIDADWAGD